LWLLGVAGMLPVCSLVDTGQVVVGWPLPCMQLVSTLSGAGGFLVVGWYHLTRGIDCKATWVCLVDWLATVGWM
jgi:hypothetical protein